VVATATGDSFESNPSADVPLTAWSDLVLIGDSESEDRFLSRYRSQKR
jgi:hypothetical protein